MEISLILAAFFVSFGSTFARLHNQVENRPFIDRIIEKRSVRDNERGTYREVLEQEAAKGQRAFRAMEDELWTARKRNFERKTKFGHENFVVKKRETASTTLGSSDDRRDSKVEALCADLSQHKQNFEMDLLVKTIRDLWLLMFPDEVGAEMKAELRTTCEGHMNEILKACGFRTEQRVELIRGQNRLQQAGVIDLRTLEGPNSTHLVVKQRYKKSSCSSLIQLLSCMETDTFEKMYPKDKVILFAFNYNVLFKEVITDWVALLYQKGDVIGAQERAKCIRAKEFNHLKYNDKLILDYLEGSANRTTPRRLTS